VSLDIPGLDAALAELADELGIPAGCRMEADLHARPVYGPGQFFVSHTDTEKNDAMIGTLTVTLPSSHTGGEFVVEHGGKSVTYRSSRDSLPLVAFYADCLHQVGVHRLYGQLGRHEGPLLVSAGRHRGVAAGMVLRRAGPGWLARNGADVGR
jgi:hypothetical protein